MSLPAVRDLCCCRPETFRNLFVSGVGRVSDLDFCRCGSVCGLRVVRLGLSFAAFFLSGSIRDCCLCRFNCGFLIVCFGVLIVLRAVPFFAVKAFWEPFGAFLMGRVNCLPDFNPDTFLLPSPLFSPSPGLPFAFFRSMFLATVTGGFRFPLPFPKVKR